MLPFRSLWMNGYRQLLSMLSTADCVWTKMNQCGISFEQTFLVDKCSRKIVNTLSPDIFKMSTISCSFSFRSFKAIFCTLLILCETIGDFQQTVLVNSSWNSLVQSFQPLFGFSSIFPHWKLCSINPRNCLFFTILKMSKVGSVTKTSVTCYIIDGMPWIFKMHHLKVGSYYPEIIWFFQ